MLDADSLPFGIVPKGEQLGLGLCGRERLGLEGDWREREWELGLELGWRERDWAWSFAGLQSCSP